MPTRSSSHVYPSPYVSIDTRKHVPPKQVRTRLGVGDQLIDHAAGKPLNVRQSRPAFQPQQSAQPAATSRSRVRHPVMIASSTDARGDWDDAPSLHDMHFMREKMYANDAPVDLPLRSRSTAYVIVGSLIAGFIAMMIAVFFAGAHTPAAPKESPAEVRPPAADNDPIRPIR